MGRFSLFFLLLGLCACQLAQPSALPQRYTNTSIIKTAPTPAPFIVTGVVLSVFRGGFLLDTQSSHGKIDVYSSYTVHVGESVVVTAEGSWSTALDAVRVVQATPVPSATPKPTPTTSATPNPTPTPTGQSVSLFQIFDDFHYVITMANKIADGHRYGVIWGATDPSAWRQDAPSLAAAYYIPATTDFNTSMWGALGHSLSWWQANHPTWILYSCTTSNEAPTHNVQYQSGWSGQVPLDIHNPQVVAYQEAAAASYAKSHGYTAIAADQVVLFNANYTSSSYACGTWNGSSFTREYSNNQDDPQLGVDMAAWVKQTHAYFKSQGLSLVVNSPAGNLNNSSVASIISNTDYDLNESGFTDYGRYASLSGFFANTLSWAQSAQRLGTHVLINDEFSGTSALSSAQREFVVASYLIANEGRLSVYAGPSNDYGGEEYYPTEYMYPYGIACSEPVMHSNGVITRRLSNALAIVNGSVSSQSLTLPPSGGDLEGRSLSSTLPGLGTYILKESNGCSLPATY